MAIVDGGSDGGHAWTDPFHGWQPLLRTAIGPTVIYVALIVLLRVAGQRTLAKWYAFDPIVTVALGSTFANSVLSNNITVAQSYVGFIVLIGLQLQFLVAFALVHWGHPENHRQPAADAGASLRTTTRCAASALPRPMFVQQSAPAWH